MNGNTGRSLVPLCLAFLVVLAGCGQTGPDPSRVTSPDTDHPMDEGQSKVAYVSVAPERAAFLIGQARRLDAVAYDSAGNPLRDRMIHWSSSDASIARVDETGLVTGMGIGSATVSALCDDKQADATIVVREQPSVLVDASRDGGVWWFPQAGSFDPDLHHQGKAFADYLRSLGFRVRELPRPTRISLELLEGYDLVVRAVAFGSYAESEVLAYRRYVEEGGRLLLLDDHKRYAPLDAVGFSFGLLFAGITRGDQVLKFVSDPITEGLEDGRFSFLAGSGLVEYPPEAKILAYLDESSYLDLDADGFRDDGEPVAPPVMGRLNFGDGLIVFIGDTNFVERVPQPLTDNLIRAFLPGVITGQYEYAARSAYFADPPCVAGCS